MKIFSSKCVYVQIKDILFFSDHDWIPCPSLITDLFINRSSANDLNMFEFVKFDDLGIIDFFKNSEFIIDYNDFKDLSDNEIHDKITADHIQLTYMYKMFNSSSDEKTKSLLAAKIFLHRHYLSSLSDISNFKQGKLEIILPDCIDYPKSENNK